MGTGHGDPWEEGGPVGSTEKVLQDRGREPGGAWWRQIPGRAQQESRTAGWVSEREREEEAGDGRAVPSLCLKGPAQSGGKACGRRGPNSLRPRAWRWREAAAARGTLKAAPVFGRGWMWELELA